MDGPQHYQEAEALIDSADSLPRSRDGAIDPLADHLITQAQVHATLALAAATALNGEQGMVDPDFSEWRAVAGSKA